MDRPLIACDTGDWVMPRRSAAAVIPPSSTMAQHPQCLGSGDCSCRYVAPSQSAIPRFRSSSGARELRSPRRSIVRRTPGGIADAPVLYWGPSAGPDEPRASARRCRRHHRAVGHQITAASDACATVDDDVDSCGGDHRRGLDHPASSASPVSARNCRSIPRPGDPLATALSGSPPRFAFVRKNDRRPDRHRWRLTPPARRGHQGTETLEQGHCTCDKGEAQSSRTGR